MTVSLYTKDQLPTTSEQAIRQFKLDYLMGVSAKAPSTWARKYGDVQSIDAPRATYPISYITTKYRETQSNNGRFSDMDESSFDMKVVEYDAGHQARMIDLTTQSFAYRRWQSIPGRFINGEERHLNRNIVTLLEAGTSTTCNWEKAGGVNFFSTSHLANGADAGSTTWSNYQASVKDPAVLANLQAEMTSMRAVPDENGDKLGVEPDTILLPTGKFQYVHDLLSVNLISNGSFAISNPMIGTLNCVHVPELVDVDDWYLVDSKMLADGLSPWAASKYVPASSLGLRFWDESSDFFKDTSSIKVSSHVWWAFALVYPHAIRLIKGA